MWRHVFGDPAVTHQVGDLVRRLGVEASRSPTACGCRAAPEPGQALLAADEVRELHRVADEEHRGVVADEVVVALGGVELQREAARVAPGVGAALLAGHGGEARQHLGPARPAGTARPWCTRETSSVVSNTPNAPLPLACDVALRHALAVEVRHLLEEVDVVQQDRAVGADSVSELRSLAAGAPSRVRGARRAGLLCHAGSPSSADGVASVRLAVGAEAPVGDLGLVDRGSRVALLAPRHGASPTAQSTSATAPQPAAHHVVVVVADAGLEPGGGAGRLDPPDQAGVGQRAAARRRRPGWRPSRAGGGPPR